MQKLDVLLGTESYLDDNVFDSEVFPSTYAVYRKDRNKHGGGVFIAIRENLPSYQIQMDLSLEIIWVCLHIDSNNDVILGSFYCPPNSPTLVLDNLNDSLGHIKLQFPNTNIILGGDFNCPSIVWHTETLTDSYISTFLREALIEIADDYQLQQVVTFPTKGNNLLDLCFTSHPDLVQSCLPFPGLCDHDIVLVKFLFQLPSVKQCPRLFAAGYKVCVVYD